MTRVYDVVIPARDEAPTIGAVIEAAYRAPHVGRVIVVDDGSTDDTASVARNAGAEIINSKGNGSKALALATGVAASTAEVLVFFDADILAVARYARPDRHDRRASSLPHFRAALDVRQLSA